MDLAYDISIWNKDSVPSWLEMWAAREFGSLVASQTAVLMNNYTLAAGRRKYELIDPSTFSLIDYDEADHVLNEWEAMQSSAQSIMADLPTEPQPAFFEMVYHPVTAGCVLNDIMISVARNNLFAQQDRSSANAIAQHVLDKFVEDAQLSKQYNELLDGEWAHMMDQTHTYWQQPMRQALPGLQYVMTSERDLAGDMGMTVQNSNATVPGDDNYHTLSSNTLTMSTFDPYGVTSQLIEICSMGTNPVMWNLESNASYVHFSEASGSLAPDGTTDVRVYATVDWDNCPPGTGQIVQVNISSSSNYSTTCLSQTQHGTQYSMPMFMLSIKNTKVPSSYSNGFVESDGHKSIEVEHWSSVSNPSSSVSYGGLCCVAKSGCVFGAFATKFRTQISSRGAYSFTQLHISSSHVSNSTCERICSACLLTSLVTRTRRCLNNVRMPG